jgi:hypothetical protein
MPQAKLDEMWSAGFCAVTVGHAAGTEPGEAGRLERLRFMRTHIHACPTCRLAMAYKNLEMDVAKAMGKLELFQGGGDITREPGFRHHFTRVLGEQLLSGEIDIEIINRAGQLAQERSSTPNPVRAASRG